MEEGGLFVVWCCGKDPGDVLATRDGNRLVGGYEATRRLEVDDALEFRRREDSVARFCA